MQPMSFSALPTTTRDKVVNNIEYRFGSMIGIITLNAYWHSMKTDPFVSVAVVVEVDKKLTDVIAEEMGRKKSTADIVIARDLKAVKSFGGKDVKQLLDHQFSVFYNLIGAEAVKELHVVFNKPILHQAKPASYADILMQRAKPTKTAFVSKFDVKEVEEFISGYAAASNKEKYLRNYPGEKPSITEQHEAYAVSFLNKNNLTYSPGVGGEEVKAKSALSRLIRTVQILTEHRDVMSYNQITSYDSCELLEMSKVSAPK